MELNRGRCPFPIVEVPSDMKQEREREMDVKGQSPLENFIDHTL